MFCTKLYFNCSLAKESDALQHSTNISANATYMSDDMLMSRSSMDKPASGGGKDAKASGGSKGKNGSKAQSQGVKKLAGVSTKGMSQLTSFFTKK
jgi:hypothetical protein